MAPSNQWVVIYDFYQPKLPTADEAKFFRGYKIRVNNATNEWSGSLGLSGEPVNSLRLAVNQESMLYSVCGSPAYPSLLAITFAAHFDQQRMPSAAALLRYPPEQLFSYKVPFRNLLEGFQVFNGPNPIHLLGKS